MRLSDAETTVEEVLRPLSLDDLVNFRDRKVLDARGGSSDARSRLFGPDPEQTVLNAFATHATKLRYHGVTPSQPPPAAEPVPDQEAFLGLIRRFHERDYTVRIPDAVALSPELQRFARALEFVFHQPVTALLFWSKAGAKAIVHYDNEDNIVIQLSGRKRWFISTESPILPNDWERVGEAPPQLGRYDTFDVGPGDLLYIPRGTPHTVDSTTESLHVAILFRPVTLRDAIIAALDQLSDADRAFRETAAGRAGKSDPDILSGAVVDGLRRLLAQCNAPGFVAAAMEHRSSRSLRNLPALPKPPIQPAVTPSSRVVHADLAISHLISQPGLIHLSLPGSQLSIHPGAAPALRFIVDHPSFRVSDIPGLGDDVRVALVERLSSSGFVRLAD
jgi:hypothetical protein